MSTEDPGPVKLAIPLSLCSLPRGCTIYAAVHAAVTHGLDLAGIGQALDRSPREVRRLLTSAMVSGCLEPAVADTVREVLGVHVGRKIATQERTDQADQVAKNRQTPPDQADHVAKNRPSHASARAPDPSGCHYVDLDQLSLADPPKARMQGPPPLRAAILRDALHRAGWKVSFSQAERERIERWTQRLPLARVEAIAEAFARDTGALMRAQSVAGMFWKLLPTLLDTPLRSAPAASRTPALVERHEPQTALLQDAHAVASLLQHWSALEEFTAAERATWHALHPRLSACATVERMQETCITHAYAQLQRLIGPEMNAYDLLEALRVHAAGWTYSLVDAA